MAAGVMEYRVLRGWFYLLGAGNLLLSVALLVKAPSSPWLVVQVPLSFVGAAVGGGLLYSGVRLAELIGQKALLPSFLLKVMISVWVAWGGVLTLQAGPRIPTVVGIVVHCGLLGYLLWNLSRFQERAAGTVVE